MTNPDAQCSDETEHDPSTIQCWDCGVEITSREAAWAEVMDHDTTEGMGYETYDAPLCHLCYRKRLPSYECGTCGREYPDMEMAATCCPEGIMEGPI